MSCQVSAVDRPEVPACIMPNRFRHEIAYFMSVPGEQGVPILTAGEYFVPLEKSRDWLDAGVIRLVSPLDSEHQTEVELSDEQVEWLEWMVRHGVQHVRVA